MSRIWTQCAPKFKFSSIDRSIFRVVEAQHKNATRKLVADDEEQAILEAEIEKVKPPIPEGVNIELHYLLWTPFRYPPLDYGSRFGGVHERSLWYGSFDRRTAFAEKAYYRWKFLNDSAGTFDHIQIELTLFSVRVLSKKVADLDTAIFKKFKSQILDKVSYSETQPLGSKLRDFGVEIIKYTSARDPGYGVNVALFDSRSFGRAEPQTSETWDLLMSKNGNETSFRKQGLISPCVHTFTKNEVGAL